MLALTAVSMMTMVGCGGGAEEESTGSDSIKISDKSAINIPQCIRGLSAGDKKARAFSAFMLGEAGAAAADALPQLEKLANGPEGIDQERAAEAVEKIKNAQADGGGEES